MDSDKDYSQGEDVAISESDAGDTELKNQDLDSRAGPSGGQSVDIPGDQPLNLEVAPSSQPEHEHQASRSSSKRRAKRVPEPRPFKRLKGFKNKAYLRLLDCDTRDATQVYLDKNVGFHHSQVGLITWSPAEKEALFESLSRLGRHDLPGIAARIGSKSEVEVKQYIDLLEAAKEDRQKTIRRSYLESAEYPAAVEISQQCCDALEKAADSISLLQDHEEEEKEEGVWGESWDITPSIARSLRCREKAAPGSTFTFVNLFNLPNWLQLSERVFMNSSIPSDNWNNMGENQPSIWASAMSDFHELAVTITKQLVRATLLRLTRRRQRKMERQRSKKRKTAVPRRKTVLRRDVEISAIVLGMSSQWKEFWTNSARRLRLDVYEEPPGKTNKDMVEPLTYDEVESILSGDAVVSETRGPRRAKASLEASSDDDAEVDDEEDDYDTGVDSEYGIKQENENDEEADEIADEVNEVLHYSALELRDVRSAKQALKMRVAAERQQEAQAESHDAYASNQAELEMWRVLRQRKTRAALPKVEDPGAVHRSNMNVESVYGLRGDWASKLKYYEEWETMYSEQEEE